MNAKPCHKESHDLQARSMVERDLRARFFEPTHRIHTSEVERALRARWLA
jgi:hypothetical protein